MAANRIFYELEDNKMLVVEEEGITNLTNTRKKKSKRKKKKRKQKKKKCNVSKLAEEFSAALEEIKAMIDEVLKPDMKKCRKKLKKIVDTIDEEKEERTEG